jgi:hypothetical protein
MNFSLQNKPLDSHAKARKLGNSVKPRPSLRVISETLPICHNANVSGNSAIAERPRVRKPNRLPAPTRLEMLAAMDQARLDIAAEIAAAHAEWDTTEPYEGWRLAVAEEVQR